jgi:hypothetical protein
MNRPIERSHPAVPVSPEYSRNRHILRWWGHKHDELTEDLILRYAWEWPWYVSDAIVRFTPNRTLSAWKERDPCVDVVPGYQRVLRAESRSIASVVPRVGEEKSGDAATTTAQFA